MADAVVRRTLRGLSLAYALSWATVSMVAGPGSAALVALSGRLSYAGLFIALFYVSGAVGAAVWGRAMDRWGRRPILATSALVSGVGFAVAGFAIGAGWMAGFVVGSGLLAFGFGGVNLTRVAAAELFPPAERGRAVAWVQLSATFGAVVGPLLLILSGPLGHLFGRPPLTLVWFIAPPLLLAAAWSYLRVAEPMEIARDLARHHSAVIATPAGGGAVGGPWVLAAGGLALAASQASMASVMGVAGAAVAHEGHGVEMLGVLMLLHFVGMFGLSRLVGRTTDRLGRRVTILGGLAILAAGGALIATASGVWAFGLGLLVVGFGWSFGYIGATVLLTDATVPERRARVLGRADLGAQATAALVASAGGWWYAENGMPGLGVLAVLVVSVPFIALLLVHRPRRRPAPA